MNEQTKTQAEAQGGRLLPEAHGSVKVPMTQEQLDLWRVFYPWLRFATDEQVNAYRIRKENEPRSSPIFDCRPPNAPVSDGANNPNA